MSPENSSRPASSKGSLRRRIPHLAILLFTLLVSWPAAAASHDSKERAAKKACLSGDFAKGVSILSDLYVDSNDQTYIFNQGRCFEQSGRYEDAIIRFREYLRKNQDAGQPVDKSAERHIADCEALLAKQKAQAAQPFPLAQPDPSAIVKPAPAPAPVVQPAASPAPPPPTAPAPEASAQAPTSTSAARPGSGLRIAGMVGVGVGVAAIATGAVLAIKANSLASELEASPTSYSRSKESTRSSYATFSTVGYGVGAACVAGGAILYYLGWRQGQTASLALLPTFGPQAAGAVVQGAF
jgi:serine/threonine-protein kinase